MTLVLYGRYAKESYCTNLQRFMLTDGSTRTILPLGNVANLKAFIWMDLMTPVSEVKECKVK